MSEVHEWAGMLCLLQNFSIAHSVEIGLCNGYILMSEETGQGVNIQTCFQLELGVGVPKGVRRNTDV